MPNELPEAAYKIFAGPGLITIGNKVTSHMSAISIKVSTLQARHFRGQYVLPPISLLKTGGRNTVVSNIRSYYDPTLVLLREQPVQVITRDIGNDFIRQLFEPMPRLRSYLG